MNTRFRTLLIGAVLAVHAGAVLADSPPHGEVRAAIRILDRRIKKAPDNALLYLRRGELHRIDHNWKASASDLRRAISGGLAVGRRALAKMLLESGQLESAEREARLFLDGAPKDANGYALLARILHARELHELARPIWRRATACPGGDRPDIWIQRTRARLRRGLAEETTLALNDLDAASARLRRPVNLELEALEIERSLGHWNAAIARIDRIAEAAVRKTAWTLLRGEVLVEAGRLPAARDAFERVLADVTAAGRRGRKIPIAWQERAAAGLDATARSKGSR